MSIYYSSVKRYSWIVLVTILIAIGGAFFLTKSSFGLTQASSVVFVDANSPSSPVPPLGESSGIAKNTDYAVLLTSKPFFEYVYQSNPQIQAHGYNVDYLSKHISVSPSASTSTITITASAHSVGDAVMLANDVANGFVAYIQLQYQQELNTMRNDLQQRLVTYQQQKNVGVVSALQSKLSLLPLSVQNDVHVIQAATLPDGTSIPKSLEIVGIAAAIGLLLGIVLIALMIFLDDRILRAEEVKEKLGLAYLGNISSSRQIAKNRAYMTGSSKQEIINIWINSQLVGVLPDRKKTSRGAILLVTSAQSAEGKTTVAAALATAFVQDGSSVVVVDTNLQEPSTHLALDMTNAGPGLNGLLRKTGGSFIDVAAQRSKIPGVWLLPAGTPSDASTLLLKRELPGILSQLREKVDLIIIDAPPLLSSAEAPFMTTIVDGVILVVDSRHSKLALLLRAKEILTSLSHKPTGVILNHFSTRRNNPYYIATLEAADQTSDPRAEEAVGAQSEPKRLQTRSLYDLGGDLSYNRSPFIVQSDAQRTINSNGLR